MDKMSKILVSGVVNLEMSCGVNNFPIEYQPVEYNFFKQSVNAAGVGYNLTSALCALGDEVCFAAMTGKDLTAKIIDEKISEIGATAKFQNILESTPVSCILYDQNGRRKIYSDLKDVQSKSYDFSAIDLKCYDLILACNVNFNRPLLHLAKSAGVRVATDVHVLGNAYDDYNREFMECADILFLSNEAVHGREEAFVEEIKNIYKHQIIVMGCGSEGAIMYTREKDSIIRQNAYSPEKVVNTVGAGDSLFSSFLSLYTKGYEPEVCLRLAQCFAAHKIGFNGASVGFMNMTELLACRN